MAHQSLYRKHRPASFKEVVGQEQITETLAEQVKGKTVGHAYLFAGSRGLGKTSIARIFAREIGCAEQDLHEIDAASHNGVDHIRELSENVYALPFASPYKVYILDEVHMLSKGAWNAFLKTLEEPPSHAVFILATTELEKVPETVQSRCQVFQFKKPTAPVLAKVVASVAKKEGYEIEGEAATLIAYLGDGSYRDALSILERIVSGAEGKKITLEQVETTVGAPKHSLVLEFVSALSQGNADAALAGIRAVDTQGIDMRVFLEITLTYMRAVLLVRHAQSLRAGFKSELGEERYAAIEGLALAQNSKMTHDVLKVFLDASGRMRYASVLALPLELAVLTALGKD